VGYVGIRVPYLHKFYFRVTSQQFGSLEATHIRNRIKPHGGVWTLEVALTDAVFRIGNCIRVWIWVVVNPGKTTQTWTVYWNWS